MDESDHTIGNSAHELMQVRTHGITGTVNFEGRQATIFMNLFLLEVGLLLAPRALRLASLAVAGWRASQGKQGIRAMTSKISLPHGWS